MLLADRPATVTYDGPKPADLLAEDQQIGAMRLELRPEAVTITQAEQVFANQGSAGGGGSAAFRIRVPRRTG